MKRRVALVLALYALLVSPFAFSSAQTLPFEHRPVSLRVCLDFLECYKTTEEGEDELYFLVSWRGKREEQIGSQRLTGPDGGNWSISSASDRMRLSGVTLWQGSLLPGDSVEIIVSLFEEDGGSLTDYEQLGTRVSNLAMPDIRQRPLQDSPNQAAPLSPVQREIDRLGLIDPRYSDDFLGAFSVKVFRSATAPFALSVSQNSLWTELDHCPPVANKDYWDLPGPRGEPTCRILDFNGANGDFRAWVNVGCVEYGRAR